MTIALGILTFVVVLAALILAHELGHFVFAKLMGVRVEEFGLGFPPRVKSWRRNGTIYSLNAIPIGGFVKMLGEGSGDASSESFNAKPPWRRFVVLAAGPAMNLMLAVIIFFFVFMGGSSRFLTVVTQVAPNSPAAQVNLRPGDRIVQVDRQKVYYYEDLAGAMQGRVGQRVSLAIERGSRLFQVSLVPRVHPPKTQGPMGIETNQSTAVRYSPVHAASLAVQQVGDMVLVVPTLLQSVSQHNGPQVSGPIGIARVTTDVVRQEPKQGPGSLFEFVALLSANLGVLNLLPVPALDGGRIVFVLISWVRRRNLDPEVEGLIHMMGMAMLLLLIAIISYQDVVRWLSGSSF